MNCINNKFINVLSVIICATMSIWNTHLIKVDRTPLRPWNTITNDHHRECGSGK